MRRLIQFPVLEVPIWPVRPVSCCPLRVGDKVRIRGSAELEPGRAHRTAGPAFGVVVGFQDGYAFVQEIARTPSAVSDGR